MNAKKLASLIRPTFAEVAVCFFVAIIIGGVVFQGLILEKLPQVNGIIPFLGTGTHAELTQLNQFPAAGYIVEGLFWAMVGVLGYVAYLGLSNAVVEMRNEVVIGTQYANKGRYSNVIAAAGFEIVAGLVLAIVLWVTANLGLPAWFSLMGQMVIDGFSWLRLAELIVSVVGLTLNIYLVWILAKISLSLAS